jgi:hypothetical protein
MEQASEGFQVVNDTRPRTVEIRLAVHSIDITLAMKPMKRRRGPTALHDRVQAWHLCPVVDALQALRGVQFTIAVTSVADLGDLTCFDKPTQLMSDLGLTPSEYSTGDHRRQGAITKTNNAHARRALLEGAWAYRYPAKVSRHLQLRLEKVPKAIQVIGWIQGVINKERQALVEEIIRGLPKSKGIEQEGLIYDLYTKIGWNDYRNTANEYLLTALNRRRADETNLYTINSASCCGVYPDRLLLE